MIPLPLKRILPVLFMLWTLSLRAQQLTMGDKQLTFELPNPLWHEALIDSNPKVPIYRTVFKREAVEAANRILVIPNIEIVIEKTKMNLVAFSANKQRAIAIKIDSNLTPKNGVLALPNAKAYFGHYYAKNRMYKMCIIQCVYKGYGVQIVLDCTADIYDEVWVEFRYFVESLKLE
jgi:hypothetical protein